MKRYLLAIGIVFCIGGSINAQILKPVPIVYTHNNIQQKVFLEPFATSNIDFNRAISYSTSQLEFNFKYELPKGAIFCRMEDAIYNKLNFWVKFRMGTDEKYSN